MTYLAKEGGVGQIHFLLAQYVVESYSIPKSFGNVARLPADIQKKWPESYLEKLKLLKNRNVYKVVDLSKRSKAIMNCWMFNIKSDSYYKSWFVVKGFSQVEEINFDKLFSPVINYETAYLFLTVAVLED